MVELNSHAWFRRSLLALLLAGALLVCHGALGASHQVQEICGATAAMLPGEHASHAHPDHAGQEGHNPGQAEGCLDCVAYAAVLVAIPLGALLWLLDSAQASWIGVPASSLAVRRFARLVPHPARCPTRTVLQAFRL
jgi:hypothetical protein